MGVDITSSAYFFSLAWRRVADDGDMMQSLTDYANQSDYDDKDRRDVIKKNQNTTRDRDHLTNDIASFAHLMKANIGIGTLVLPLAIKNAGYIVGPIGILVIGFIATHCMGLLVESARKLCEWNELPELDYSEAMQFALKERGSGARVAMTGKFVVNIFLAITQFGFCSVYFVFFGDTLQQVFQEAFCVDISNKAAIAIFTLPVVLLSWIRNLDHLAPLSFLANVAIITGLVFIFYDEAYHFYTKKAAVLHGGNKLIKIGSILTISLFFGTAIFSFESIGIILPLASKMKTPVHAKPIIYICMCMVVLVYVSFGLAGYLTYGDNIQGSITLNLCPRNITTAILFSVIKILFIFSITVSYCVQFYVPMDFMEPVVHQWFEKLTQRLPTMCITHENLIQQALKISFRTIIVVLTAILAMIIPNLSDLVTLTGAISSCALTLIFPPLIHVLTFWKEKEEKFPLFIVTDISIIIFGAIGFIFGTFSAIYTTIKDFEHISGHFVCPANEIYC